MRKRYQKGSLQLRKQGGVLVWLGMWRDGGHRRTKTLGQKSEMTKAAATAILDGILAPLNARHDPQTGKIQLGDFIRDVYFPFCRRKWKRSTQMTTEDRITRHIAPEFHGAPIRSINRIALQAFLDRMAADGLSFNSVNHLRWDLRHMFRMAVADGFVERNPAEFLFTPKTAIRNVQRIATAEEIGAVFGAVDLRERLILKLAGIAGMRPGEIFGLKWANLDASFAEIRQRVYRGDVDSPKSPKSVRRAALSESVLSDVSQWRALCVSTSPEAWVFPSEIGTPLRKENIWQRNIGPKLKAVGLDWVNFQVLRRSCSSLLSDQGVEGKVVADQLGHGLDVNQNVYTRVAFGRQEEAVNRLDSLFPVN